MKLTQITTAAALAACLVLAPAAQSIASPTVTAQVKTYANCAAIHRAYSGGIAKKGVKYNTTRYRGQTHHRALKGHVKFSTALYNANKKSDRDHDGIACEKS